MAIGTQIAGRIAKGFEGASLKGLMKHGPAGVFTAASTLSAYNESREAGRTRLGSVFRAGVSFAIYDTLNPIAAMGIQMSEALPGAAMKGITTASSSLRNMNLSQQGAFGTANSFVDTNQLSTMRQSGMEMAQMSQYSLQQAMMGNEAQYMHR